MSFEETLGKAMQWQTAVDALSALGAALQLQQTGQQAPPAMADALRSILAAAGIDGLDELEPQQRMILLVQARTAVHHALELLADPAREPGWTYTEEAILESWGRGSMAVPGMIAASGVDFGDVRSVLDVGTGVGLLAVAATNVWPNASVVGIDVWKPSLERAHANVDAAGLGDRITLRDQNVLDLDDDAAFDLVWVPTFFLTEARLQEALPALVRATRPGGHIVLGRFTNKPDPLGQAALALRVARGGGELLETERAIKLLEQAGCASVTVSGQPPTPLEYVIAQRPA